MGSLGGRACGLSTQAASRDLGACWATMRGPCQDAHGCLSLAAQEVLENLKDRWYQADNPPPDLLLGEEEFLSFLHPEHSRGMLRFMVKEIVRDLGEVARPRGGACCLSRGGRGVSGWALKETAWWAPRGLSQASRPRGHGRSASV